MTTHTQLRSRSVGVVLALAFVAAGCTGTPQVQPPATTSVSSPTRLPSSAPRVSRFWDASSYRDKPCALFTDDQAKVLGYLKPGSTSMGDAGAAVCRRASDTRPQDRFTIKYYFATDLLGKIYRREVDWPANSAIPITVVGQPALKTNDLNELTCNVAVGLTDTQGFEVAMDGENATDLCARAINVAETIMHNIGA